MSLRLCTIFFFVLSYLFSFGQIRIHVGGGINFSELSFKNYPISESTNSKNAYISVRPELGLTEKLSVGVDAQYSVQGYEFVLFNIKNKSPTRFQYIDFIPQVQYKFMRYAAVFGGLGFGIRTAEHYKIADTWVSPDVPLSNPINYTYVAGLRLIPLRKFSIQTQFSSSIRSFLGLTFTDVNGAVIPDASSNINNFQLGLAYQLY